GDSTRKHKDSMRIKFRISCSARHPPPCNFDGPPVFASFNIFFAIFSLYHLGRISSMDKFNEFSARNRNIHALATYNTEGLSILNAALNLSRPLEYIDPFTL